MFTILRCAVPLFIASVVLAGQGPQRDIDDHVAGTTLAYFGKVGDGVYKGSKPKTDADYEFLQKQHIKYILDLELLPSLRHSEQKKAQRHRIVLLHARINASPISPSEKHIERIMAVLKESRYHPIYFHCAYGRDRTSLVAALYKVYYLGMSPQDALRYMDESGYKNSWVRGGLKRYLRKHPSPRAALKNERSNPALSKPDISSVLLRPSS
jgi:hypothetical protein